MMKHVKPKTLTKQEKQEARHRQALIYRKIPYEQYLKSRHWNTTRHFALVRAGYRCQVCNADNQVLTVHHRTYERLGEEANSDLIVLCWPCHELFHLNGRLKR